LLASDYRGPLLLGVTQDTRADEEEVMILRKFLSMQCSGTSSSYWNNIGVLDARSLDQRGSF